MPIIYHAEKRSFRLDTATSTYLFRINEAGFLVHQHYGARLPDVDLSHLENKAVSWSHIPEEFEKMNSDAFTLDTALLEYPTFGGGDYRSTACAIKDQSGTQTTDLRYHSHTITKGKPKLEGLPATYAETTEAETLALVLTDAYSGAEVTLLYTVFEKLGAMTRSVCVRNNGKHPLVLNRLLSTSVDLYGSDYDMIHLSGRWAKERGIERHRLHKGSQSIASIHGSSSHQNNPFLAIVTPDCGEERGEAYGFSFVYSGNFLAEAEVSYVDTTRILMGIHPEAFAWTLTPGECFVAPEVVMVYSNEGLGGMSRTFHKLYRHNLCRGKWKTEKRPILVNNWEATYFDFNHQKLLDIAKEAATLGIEMLVVDDGWFGVRNDDLSSLGDWKVNQGKFEHGISALVKDVNDLGLKFGIWFEPENISPDSDLFRAHPDWYIHIDGRAPSYCRHQFVLDMTRPEVRENIYQQMAAILNSANIEYIKWDFNRNLTEVASDALPPERQGEVYHRYVLGLYELTERILTDFPHVLLEGCSGGGGRFDAGMLYYSPQIWTSDDTDACERLTIQSGTSLVYPASAMSAHVSAVPNHQTGRITSFKTRGDVALAGAFGYELDLTKLTDEEKALARQQIADYHRYSKLIQDGDLYRLINPHEDATRSAWMYVAEDKSEAIFTYVVIRTEVNRPHRVKLSGLAPNKFYRVDGQILSGAALMHAGLSFRRHFLDGESLVLHIEEVS